LREGDFELVNPTDRNVLSYRRKAPNGSAVLVVLNCTPSPQTMDLAPARGMVGGAVATTLLSSFAKKGQPVVKDLMLPAYGSWVGQLQ